MAINEDSLFETTVLNQDQFNVVVVTNSMEVDYAFSSFEEWMDEDDVNEVSDPSNQESLLGVAFSYFSAIIDDELLEAHSPVITQAIYSDSSLVIVVELEQEILDYINDSYEDLEDVQAVLFGDADQDEDYEEDEDDDVEDEDVEDDDDSDEDWSV